MDSKNLYMWSNLSFKTLCYRKNFDMVNDNDNIITECDGTISEIRIAEYKPPIIVGEYGFSVWNIRMGMLFNIDFGKLIREHSVENTYDELQFLVNNKAFNVLDYHKVLLIHTLVLRPDYRKRGITEEFIEALYRDFHDKSTAIIALVKPFQDNPIDADFFFKRKYVQVREKVGDYHKIDNIPALEYYGLTPLMNKRDVELNEYKLFSVASKCGFSRLDNSHLFQFSPDKIIERMLEKRDMLQKHENTIENQ